MIFIYAAAMTLMAAPQVTFRRGCWLLGLSGFLIHAALMTKIQNIIVIIFLPLLPFVFDWWAQKGITKLPTQKLIWAVPVVAVILTTPIIILYIDLIVLGKAIYFQSLIPIYVILSAFIFCRLHLGAARYGFIGLGAVAIGFSLAHGLIFFNNNWWTTFSLVNFLQQMSIYQGSAEVTELSDSADALAIVLYSVKTGLINSASSWKDFVSERLQEFDYPFVVFYALVPAVTVLFAFLGKWDVAVKTGFLCLMAGLTVAVFWIGRGFFNFYYSIYIEIWVLFATAIIFKNWSKILSFSHKRWLQAGQLGFFVIIATVVIINVRYRVLDPVVASPVVPKSACFIRGLTPLLYTKFDVYCGTG
jgi:hypothetical protein